MYCDKWVGRWKDRSDRYEQNETREERLWCDNILYERDEENSIYGKRVMHSFKQIVQIIGNY